MKYRYLIFVVLNFIFVHGFCQSGEMIRFQTGDFKDMSTQAKDQNKVLIVESCDLSSLEYSILHNKVFTDPKVVGTINDNFITYHYDPKLKKEESLDKLFQGASRPTYVFIDQKQDVVSKLQGSFTPQDFVWACSIAMNPGENLVKWKKQFDNDKNLPAEFYFDYAKALYKAGENYNAAAKKYFDAIGSNLILAPNGIEAILLFADDFSDYRFMILLQSWPTLVKGHLDHNFINNKMSEIIAQGMIQKRMADKNYNFEDSINQLARQYGIESPHLIIQLSKMHYYSKIEKDDNQYFSFMIEYLNSNMEQLNELKIFQYLTEIANNCKIEEVNRMAAGLVMDLKMRNNRLEYQKLLVEILLNIGNMQEAQEALEHLEMENTEKRLYTDEQINALREKIENTSFKKE